MKYSKFAFLITKLEAGRGSLSTLCFRTKEAHKLAKAEKAQVYRMSYDSYKVGAAQPFGWDFPTFRISADLVADYREPVKE